MDFSPLERFRRYLEANGKRLTQERAVIAEVILARSESLTAEQLVELLAVKVPDRRVSRSTVYRCLSDLAKAGVLREHPGTDRSLFST